VEDDHLILILLDYIHKQYLERDKMDQDFVSFGRSPSPAPSTSTIPSTTTSQNAKAGPSRSKPQENGGTPKGPKGKKRSRSKDDEGPGPRNLKEEKKARDRSAPWCELVDWSGCRDPAEM
jgi:hypothetical protein